jgi:branched-chain amino acid transport system ATP-binding protein
MLEVHNLTVRYGGVVAVDQVSLHASQGEVVTLIGANGAGKSTTIRAISRMLDPASGTVAFDGADITSLKAHQAVRQGISECPEGGCWPARPCAPTLNWVPMSAKTQRRSRPISTA